MDIYRKLKPETSDRGLVTVGRLATAVVVVLGILWIPVMSGISGVLYQYLQSVQSYLAPPIAAVFLLGIFFRRINAKGAMVTLTAGFGVGLLRIILELQKDSLSGWLHSFATLNFLYFCILLFAFSIVVLVGVSLMTEPPSEQQLAGLTFGTISDYEREKTRSSWSVTDVVLSVMVVVIIISVFVYFSPLGVGG